MKKILKWIKLKYDESPNKLWCIRCGEKRTLHLPASIDDAVKQGEAFAEYHKFCKAADPRALTSRDGDAITRI